MTPPMQLNGAQHCAVVAQDPPSTSHARLEHTPDVPVEFGQYGALEQQSALELQKSPPQVLPPSGIPASSPQIALDVQPSVQGRPLSFHWPLLPQVCGCAPAHCIVPGLHTPVHFVPTHACPRQLTGAAHMPVGSQLWMSFGSAHWVWPGLHTPWHAPPTHVCPVHGAGVPHWPAELHVC